MVRAVTVRNGADWKVRAVLQFYAHDMYICMCCKFMLIIFTIIPYYLALVKVFDYLFTCKTRQWLKKLLKTLPQ